MNILNCCKEIILNDLDDFNEKLKSDIKFIIDR